MQLTTSTKGIVEGGVRYVKRSALAGRRRELPSPTPLQPKRRELIEDIHLEEPDPARYDRLCGDSEPDPEEPQA